MKRITVFTPAYNRAHTLTRTYESLLRQTSKEFEWLIIDDGSTDNTRELVAEWIDDARLPIRYIHKPNGGLHTAYNVAIGNIDSELCVCCDSDDYLPPQAIEHILDIWQAKGSNLVAGIIGLDFIAGTDKPIGGFFSDTSQPVHFLELGKKAGHYGDVKMVHRTELLRPLVPMPSYAGEKNFNPIYLFLLIDPSLGYILTNENLCYVDYQQDGMSANIYSQYLNSPRSFAAIRKARLAHPKVSGARKVVDAAHLVSSALIAKDAGLLRDMPKKWLLPLAIPAGLAIYGLIRYKTRQR